jgi:EAL domain-containing protein (putative c-di-GMP-specific phosphodiesterase class I)
MLLSASVGISLYPDDGDDVTSLISNADAAMNQAKAQGRNNYQFYTQEMTEVALQRVTLGSELRRALDKGELVLFYQPQYSLQTGKMMGAEALIRWQHPQQGMIPPDKFIPLAEDNGLIIPMGEWVLKKACQQMRAWLDMGMSIERIGVNVSGQQMQRGELVSCVEQVLAETGLEAKHLELEITESCIMRQTEKVISTLEGLQRLGVVLAIDDFGTGYSSLSYLKQLPVHKLKIDKSFICDIPTDANDEVIARAVLALGQSLELKVIAEGVETEAQQEFLRALNCDEVQGYLYSRPVPAEEFVELKPVSALLSAH